VELEVPTFQALRDAYRDEEGAFVASRPTVSVRDVVWHLNTRSQQNNTHRTDGVTHAK
jgi:hypothetical protein